MGVPVIGCDCAVCSSFEERNKRTRSSVVLRHGDVTLLVDSGPDLRLQALRERLRAIDAVIYTHGHLDHVAGFDELRAFCWQRTTPLPLHATPSCMELLMRMYGWAFFPERVQNGYVRPDPRLIQGEFTYGDLRVTPLPVQHASIETVGFLFEVSGARSVAYLPDVKVIPATTMKLLAGVDVLVVDALRPAPHPTHFSLAEALAVVAETGAKETWLTHLSHDYDARTFGADLPPGVHLAWDGLRISLGDTAGLA